MDISIGNVMTFARPTTADKHPVGSIGEGPENKGQVDSVGAHEPNDPDLGRIL
jgi:hypothetical protein